MIRYAKSVDFAKLSELDAHISENELKSCIERQRILIYKENDCIVGWLRFGMFWDNTPFMNMLYIIDGKRDKGLGTALCEFWENEMKVRGYDIVLTSTLSNEQAQHFYRKRGYRDCGSLILPEEPLEIIFMKEL